MADQLLQENRLYSACRNCGEYIEKKFCAHCGQKHDEHRIHIGSLLHDIPHAIFHVDQGFFFNVVQLFKRPGAAIGDYLAGRRKSFFHPITYLAILLVFNLFAVKITDLHYYDEKELLSMTSAEVAFIREYDASQWWFLEHTYLYMLVAIPIGAAFCYGFFRLFRIRFNFAENAIILMFIIAQGVLIQSVLYLLTGWVRNGVFIRTVEIVNLFLMLSYATYAIYRFINPRRKRVGVWVASLFAGMALLGIMLGSAYLLMYLSELMG